jgi:hypothetical protein
MRFIWFGLDPVAALVNKVVRLWVHRALRTLLLAARILSSPEGLRSFEVDTYYH